MVCVVRDFTTETRRSKDKNYNYSVYFASEGLFELRIQAPEFLVQQQKKTVKSG